MLVELQSKQHEREKVKDDKREIIRNIMSLLEQLKTHREERAYALVGLFQGSDITIQSYQEFVDSLETFARSREGLVALEQEQAKVEDELNLALKRSIDAAQHFTERQSDEARLFTELNSFYRQKIKLIAM